jgi:hypothetical protein
MKNKYDYYDNNIDNLYMSVHNINLCVPLGLIIKTNHLPNKSSEISPILINQKMLKENIYDKLLNSVKYDRCDICDTYDGLKVSKRITKKQKKQPKKQTKKHSKN